MTLGLSRQMFVLLANFRSGCAFLLKGRINHSDVSLLSSSLLTHTKRDVPGALVRAKW